MEHNLRGLASSQKTESLLNFAHRHNVTDQLIDKRRLRDHLHHALIILHIIQPVSRHQQPFANQIRTHPDRQILGTLADKRHPSAPPHRINTQPLARHRTRTIHRAINPATICQFSNTRKRIILRMEHHLCAQLEAESSAPRRRLHRQHPRPAKPAR